MNRDMIGRKREPTTCSTKHDPEPFSRFTQLALVPHPKELILRRDNDKKKGKRTRQEKKKEGGKKGKNI